MPMNLIMLIGFVIIMFIQKLVTPHLRDAWGVAVLPTVVLIGGWGYVLTGHTALPTLLWSITLVTVLALIILLMGVTQPQHRR